MSLVSASLKVGSTMAVGSAILQQSSPAAPVSANVLVPVVSAMIGGIISYAVLKTTVQKMEQDMRDTRRDISEMYTLLRETMTKLAHLEGRWQERS